MKARDTETRLEQIIEKIHMLDLAPIKFKLMDAEEGLGWSREYADHVEVEYKRFLTLLAKYPEASIAPTREVDKFWHGHILDTLKYSEDCNSVFGYFLHHFPYFGMRGSEDAANLAAAAATMTRLYQQEFGDSEAARAASYCGAVRDDASRTASAAPSYCGVVAERPASRETQASYCGAVRGTSYCGIAPIDAQGHGAAVLRVLNPSVRPQLPR